LNELAVPQVFRAALDAVRIEDRHPGLQLDRLVIPGDQEQQRASLLEEVRAAGDRRLFAEIRRRREAWFRAAGVEPWQRVTSGPLTLHLARANALENAGLCLHPVYGFPYLPGSGLKGLARAYATVAVGADKQDILAVFGNEPGAWEKDGQHAGGVVFHDAWPVDWPALTVDITNNHHPHYYQGEDAPGDWDSPVPVYFLAIPPGSTFEFALARRRDDGDSNRLLGLAQKWLNEALTTAGAGAKTAAGYGSFTPLGTRSPAGPNRAEAILALELITPAFLAGALQDGTDCTLRTATLRGHLRWWWRTLHAGFLTVEELRLLEAAVWGDTAGGSAVRVELTPLQPGRVNLYSHPQERQSGSRYVAYGMDEKSRGERRQRYLLAPGAAWELRLTTRRTDYHPPVADPRNPPPPITLTKQQVLEQVLAAVWLLGRFGGVGSKGRKGFGSLAAAGPGLPTALDRCLYAADRLRRDSLGIARDFDPNRAEPGSLADPERQLLEIAVSDRDVSQVIERVGRAYAAVAARYEHDAGKAAWGLPRKIHGPKDEPMQHQSAASHQPPEWLDFPKRPTGTRPENSRHASPIHLHIDREAGGGYLVRLLAMPACQLRNRAESVRMLQAFVEAFREQLQTAAAQPGGPGRGPGAGARPAPARPGFELVEVLLLERMEKSGPNAFRVQEEGKPKGMLVTGTPPNPLPEVGTKVRVYREVGSDPRSPRYRWDAPPPPPPPARKPGGPPRRR
jgi:CRISPR-associated protein Cmr6